MLEQIPKKTMLQVSWNSEQIEERAVTLKPNNETQECSWSSEAEACGEKEEETAVDFTREDKQFRNLQLWPKEMLLTFIWLLIVMQVYVDWQGFCHIAQKNFLRKSCTLVIVWGSFWNSLH